MNNLSPDSVARPVLLLPDVPTTQANTIGLIIPPAVPAVFSHPAYSPLVQGIAQGCHHHQYQMLLYLCHESPDADSIRDQLQSTAGLAGIICVAADDDPVVADLTGLEPPLLRLEPPLAGKPGSPAASWSPAADSPMLHAGRRAVETLLQQVAGLPAPAARETARPLLKEPAWGAVN